MKHTYSISGMSCNDCRTHVEEALKRVEGVTKVSVDLQKAEAVIEMESHIPLEKFQEALKTAGEITAFHYRRCNSHNNKSMPKLNQNLLAKVQVFIIVQCIVKEIKLTINPAIVRFAEWTW